MDFAHPEAEDEKTKAPPSNEKHDQLLSEPKKKHGQHPRRRRLIALDHHRPRFSGPFATSRSFSFSSIFLLGSSVIHVHTRTSRPLSSLMVGNCLAHTHSLPGHGFGSSASFCPASFSTDPPRNRSGGCPKLLQPQRLTCARLLQAFPAVVGPFSCDSYAIPRASIL